MFANGPGDLGSVQGRVIPKTRKMVLDTALLNTQQYKVRINCKVGQSRERRSTFPYTSVLQLLKREPSDRPRLRSPTLLIYKPTYLCTRVYIHTYTYKYKHINTHTLTYILIYSYIHNHTCTHTRTYIHTYIHTYVYKYLYIHIRSLGVEHFEEGIKACYLRNAKLF